MHGIGTRGDFATILTKNAPAALQGAVRSLAARTSTRRRTTTRTSAGLRRATDRRYPGHDNFNYMEFAEFGGGSWQLGFDLFAPDPAVAKGFVEEASYPPGGHRRPP